MAYIQTSALIPAPRADVFAYVSALKHLPEWLGEGIQVAFPQVPAPMKLGREYTLQMSRFGVTREIVLRIEQYKKNEIFVDRQVHGFFQHWLHTQTFEIHDEKTTLLSDIVEYTMPFGLIGQLADDLYVRLDMTHLLNHRYERILQHFESIESNSSQI